MRSSHLFQVATCLCILGAVDLRAQTYPAGRWYPAYDWHVPQPTATCVGQSWTADGRWFIAGGQHRAPAWSRPHGHIGGFVHLEVEPTVVAPRRQHPATITLPPGAAVGKVVMMRPGSLTHHGDMDQRYVQLKILGGGDETDSVTFQAPVGPPGLGGGIRAPLGYYMIFLVTSSGVPSEAEFIRFQ